MNEIEAIQSMILRIEKLTLKERTNVLNVAAAVHLLIQPSHCDVINQYYVTSQMITS